MTDTTPAERDVSVLKALLERVETATGPDNLLDIAIDVALFVPDERHASVHPNDARTKVVYERRSGGVDTHWANDHTLNAQTREKAASTIKALISQQESSHV